MSFARALADARRRARDRASRPEHALAEVDDDGHLLDSWFRRYRFVCRCGRAGDWVDSPLVARGHHAVHADAADTASGSGEVA